MISFAVRKIHPFVSSACKDCVKKNGDIGFCDNFCKLNEQIVFICPYCEKEGSNMGIRNATNPLICKFCNKDVSGLNDMSQQIYGEAMRIGYHKKVHIYAKANN